MSRLLRSTTCDGKPGSCRVQLGSGSRIANAQPHHKPDLHKLVSRLHRIHNELRKVHPRDIQRARALQADAETTFSVFRTANGGESSITVDHVMGLISELVKSSFGKVGQFFTHLSQRQPSDTEIQNDVTDEAERHRFLRTIRFRKTLPSL